MPLTKRQFQLRVDEEGERWMRQIYDLLAEHRELAYSAEELRQSVLTDPDSPAKRDKLDRALEVLVGIGAVDQRDVAGTDYYGFQQEFDTNTWKSMRLAS